MKKKKKNSNRKSACSSGKNRKNMLYNAGMITGKAVTGAGIGAVAGLGTLVAAAFAEVTLPTLFVVKIFGLTGGAIGLMRGIKGNN